MAVPDRSTLLSLFRTMATIRAFEERHMQEVNAGKPVGGGHSSIGQEAVPTGVCAHLTERDFVASTHRGHGHCIAKGVDVKQMMAELYGRSTGVCRGKGGSMHIADVARGMLGANGVVGSNLPLATGAALTAKLRGQGQVSVSFFGDGAANQGTLHESLNLASIWKLPVIYVCENNLYAESTPVEYSTAVPNVAQRAAGYGIPGMLADGMDVMDVFEKAGEAVARARRGEGPTLLECKTYRYFGHFLADDPHRYRSKEEEEQYRERDPLVTFKKRAIANEWCSPQELEAEEKRAQALMDEAVRFAEDSPPPSLDDLVSDVYVSYPRIRV